jgi:anti-sigma regulatory factor (Ser/Thr protein kinase)
VGGQPEADIVVLRLPAAAAAVPAARAHVRERLAHCEPDVVDAAELCMSELATNGFVHARTELEARVEVLADRVRLEIRDYSPVLPRQIVHSSSATTGRGLDLVRVLAAEWGVSLVEGNGKVVWCELALAPAPPDPAGDTDALLAAWPDDLDDAPAEPAPLSPRENTAILLGYPVRLGMRAQEHTDGLLRECLLVHQAAAAGHTSAPGQLVALADMITARYSAVLAEPERRKAAAYAMGDATIDLVYPLPAETGEVVAAWQAASDALDAYAAQNALLTLQTPPDIAALQAWAVQQFLAQADGAAPTRWSGPLD